MDTKNFFGAVDFYLQSRKAVDEAQRETDARFTSLLDEFFGLLKQAPGIGTDVTEQLVPTPATDPHVDGPAPEVTATVEAAATAATPDISHIFDTPRNIEEIHQNRNLSGTTAQGGPR